MSHGIDIDAVACFVTADRLRLDVTAVADEFTAAYDRQFAERNAQYLSAARRVGIRNAGEPPRHGACTFMEPDLSATLNDECLSSAVKYVGGTGTEWLIRWEWTMKTQGDVDITLTSKAGINVVIVVSR